MQIVNQFYSAGRPAMDACRFLIAKAAVLWRKYEGDYRDDITAVVVYLDLLIDQLMGDLQPVAESADEEAAAPGA